MGARGENAKKKIEYRNPVTGVVTLVDAARSSVGSRCPAGWAGRRDATAVLRVSRRRWGGGHGALAG